MNKEQLLESLRKQEFPERIIQAFSRVQRENFINPKLKQLAYDDIALPLNHGETISQPSTIAVMLSLLKLHDNQKVLEIGSGCGYVLALISEIIGRNSRVFGVEISRRLTEKSRETLRAYKNTEVFNRNGKNGLKEKEPFDRILISAAVEKIPDELLNQLKENGIIVAPINYERTQVVTSIRKHNNELIVMKRIPGFIFVPFIE